MSDKLEYVDYQEPLSIKVGRFLVSKGFDLALSYGRADPRLIQSDSLGILRMDPEAMPRKYLFGIIKRNPLRMFLGTVWFNNSPRCADEQNWVFEMHGRKHVNLVRQLAEEMASTFNVKIILRLVSEQPRFEDCLDYDF